jgi:prepilin-type N-terminal cleavage/methylation domain-containing protein
MQKLLKTGKGFTLVEVIVTVAIVLVLAAVAIPLYNGYVKSSKIDVATNLVAEIAEAVVAGIESGAIILKSNGDVDEAASFKWNFSQKSDRDRDGVLQFASMPNSASQEDISIVLPKGFTVAIAGGKVTVHADPDPNGDIMAEKIYWKPTVNHDL